MSNLPYKNPISPIQEYGTPSVRNTDLFGTHFSVYGVGGYMEVYNVSDLYYTIPSNTYGVIQFSGNTIPINFSKGSGSTFSIDTLTLNSDLISSGRRRLGMLVYVYETDQIYQFLIDNYDTLWSAATASTGTVVSNQFGTIVRANSSANQSFINAWTGNTIEGISGATRSTAVWKKLATGGGGGSGITGGTYYPSTLTLDLESTGGTISINSVTGLYISAGTYTSGTSTLNLFNSTGGTISITGITAGSGGSGGTSNFQYFISGSSPTGTINDGDRWFYTESGEEFVWVTDQNSSQWVQPVSISYGVSEEFVHITGDTMTGTLYVPTISATTYQNLPGSSSSNCVTTFYATNISGCSPVNMLTEVNMLSGLTVTGNGYFTGVVTATTISAVTMSSSSFSGSSDTITGTKGSVITSGSSTTAFITVSGSNTVGGTGYTDFIQVTNTAAGATNPNKTIRVNNTGAIEFLNSVYNALSFSIGDNGIVTITSPASVTSNSATNNALNVGTKGQLFDDGNLHIHSSTGSVWINSLDGSAIRIGTQTNSGNSTVLVDTSTVGHSFFTKVQSGFNVAFGTEITMDNLKVRINGTGGSGGLVQGGAVSGTFAAYTTLLGNVAGSALQGDTNSGGITFTTTYQDISSGQKTLSAGGDTTTLHLIDTTNSRIYRITAIHCQGTTGGYTSIERMA